MSTRMKYDFERLDKYCKENNVTLLEDYSDCKLTKDTYIKSKCSYENCSNDVNKNFRELENAGSYCKSCIKLKSTEVRKQTCLQKYGVENVTKKHDYKSKFISPKYNYDTLKEFCDKNQIELFNDYKNVKLNAHYYIEGKCQNNECGNNFNKKMHKLITTNGMCNQCIFEKAKEVRKNTNLKNFGCENCFQNQDIKQKIRETNKIRYGVEYVIQNQEIKNKIKETVLNKYGVEHISYCKEIQDKITKTNIEKYGVEHLMKNPEYLDNILKKSYKFKDYKLPSGNIIQIQGYEHYALDELIINNKIDELDIITGIQNVPKITYTDNKNIVRDHHGDIFIPKQNRIIEVKSTWTFQKPDVLLKQKAGKKLGYNYEIWVYDKKGNKTIK
jgi:hypothetical protein